jgi:hypothetical protein
MPVARANAERQVEKRILTKGLPAFQEKRARKGTRGRGEKRGEER